MAEIRVEELQSGHVGPVSWIDQAGVRLKVEAQTGCSVPGADHQTG